MYLSSNRRLWWPERPDGGSFGRSEDSNWFINAQVRLWKPMVEEMYQQESKDEEDTIDHHDQGDEDDDGDCDGDEALDRSHYTSKQSHGQSSSSAQTPSSVALLTTTTAAIKRIA
ncbi:hypothetical protein Sjap_001618 [Stephania japonica]|uniref:Uncharacterized protein n=1 Tax=Stephania japonica TaxID=461633 RepID=A0AAP0KK90_9MAGN